MTNWVESILRFADQGLLNFSWWKIIVCTLTLTHITIAAVTIYLHRHQAHRALDLHPIVSHFFRFWLWLSSGLVTKEWAAVHRKHHARCELPGDPHSPVVFGIKKVLREGVELYREEAKKTETLAKYGHGTPDDWLERNVYSPHSIVGVSIMLIIQVMLFGVAGIAVWGILMLWVPVTAAGIINGLGHYWGYRNYDCADASTNIVPWGILIGGEELHNNHHTFASSAKLSSKWYEFDIGWAYICILKWLGLAKVKKLAPSPKFLRGKSTIDINTLQAIIHNRYEVMAQYARSVRSVWQGEHQRLINAARFETRFLKNVQSLLKREPRDLAAQQKEQLGELFSHSKAMQTMHEMRIELGTIWERSSISREQLVQKLQDWCIRAEKSGIQALREFSLKLRSYI